MEQGPKNSPDNQLESVEKENVSWDGVWNGMKERLATYAGLVFRGIEDKELKRFEQQLDQSFDESRATGEYFRYLVPQSLHKPEKEYVHEEQLSYLEVRLEETRELQKITSRFFNKNFAENKEALLRSFDTEYEGVEQEVVGPDRAFQTKMNNFKQESSGNNIIELVVNELKEESNTAVSSLLLRDNESGKIIDLGQLLPKGYCFAPSEMYRRKYIHDESGEVIESQIPTNLKMYAGTKDSKGTFAVNALNLGEKNIGLVKYGDITKEGGILSVLHEVGHAWQMAHGLPRARSNFEDIFSEAGVLLEILREDKQEFLEGKKSEEDFNRTARHCKTKLGKLGIEIDEQKFDQASGDVVEGQRVTNIWDNSFILRSERLDNLIADYEREERDAWAHGIKALRFLRKRRIDLEPSLQNLKDIQKVVHPCLRSYQNYMDKRVESSTRKTKFARRPAEKSNSQVE